MSVRKVIFALVLAAMTTIPTTVARAQSGGPEHSAAQADAQGGVFDVLEHVKEARAQQLEGSWVVTITPAVPPGVPQPPSFLAYGTYARGGAFFGSDRRRPSSKQHGAWAHLGGNQFAWTAIEDLFDGTGNFTGSVTVRVRITVTGKDESSASPTARSVMRSGMCFLVVAGPFGASASRSSRSRPSAKASRRLSKRWPADDTD